MVILRLLVMKKINKKLLLIFAGIILIAAFMRFWQLDNVPPSLDWDEVSWGYNAFSILETGKDEYGKLLPIVIRSLDDYKPAMQAYFIVPIIAVMGLTDFAVRFPNALFGVLGTVATYFLAKELFKRRDIGLVSMFLMAISPWAIQFARFTHEGIIGLFFNQLFILFFLKGLKNPIFLSLSAICGALALYTYQNEKIFIPLLALVLLISFYKELFGISKKYLAYAFISGLVVSLPIILFTFTTPESFTRAKGASFMNNPVGVLNMQYYPERLVIDYENKDYLGIIFDNRRILYAKDIINNYLSHFNPNFLFVKGDDILRHQPPGMGHLYLIELPFFLLGLYFLIFGKFDRNVKKFILLWMLIVPIPASITWDVPNAGRTINFLPTFQMIIAVGVISFYEFVRRAKFNKFFKYGIISSFLILAIFNFLYYFNQYFFQYGYFASHDFQYGYNQIVPKVKELYPDYQKIYVSNEIPLDQSYIFFLYHLQYPPEEYQKKSSSGEYKTKHSFDKFEFTQIRKQDWERSSENNQKELFISPVRDFPDEALNSYLLQEIKLVNGETSVVIVRGK